MTTPALERVFWTPVIVEDEIDDAAAICAELERRILERRAAHATKNASNVGGWHSDYKLLDWGGDAARAVADRAVALANDHCRDTRSNPLPEWRRTAWANVHETGDFNMPHAHGGAYWSAVFYVRIDPGEGGELLLHDPRRPAIEMHAPQLRFQPSGGEMVVNMKPQPGMLVLMPGWLGHSVRRWDGDGLRISMALNLAAPPAS